MNILVTGASGFLGKNIQCYFKDKQNIIYVSSSRQEHYLKLSKNFNDINEKIQGKSIDCIIHLASAIPKSFEEADFDDCFLQNASMFNNLYNYTINNNVKKFIYLSSFGSMRDNENYDIRDYYTLSKIHGEHVCSMMKYAGIETVSLRIPSPYGPYMNSKNVVSIFIKNALNNQDLNVYGTGEREQNFIYIDDVINSINLFLNCKNKVNGVYSIVSENNTSMLELAQVVKQLCNSKSKIVIGKYNDTQNDFVPNYSYKKAYEAVGYTPQYSIYSGLKKYIDWFKKSI